MAAPTSPTITPTKVGPNGSGANGCFSCFVAAAASDGDAFRVTGKEALLVGNKSGGTITVTVKSAADNFGNVSTTNDLVIGPIANNEVAMIGPIDPAKFADANGLAQVNYSSPTNVKVGVVNFGTIG